MKISFTVVTSVEDGSSFRVLDAQDTWLVSTARGWRVFTLFLKDHSVLSCFVVPPGNSFFSYFLISKVVKNYAFPSLWLPTECSKGAQRMEMMAHRLN